VPDCRHPGRRGSLPKPHAGAGPKSLARGRAACRHTRRSRFASASGPERSKIGDGGGLGPWWPITSRRCRSTPNTGGSPAPTRCRHGDARRSGSAARTLARPWCTPRTVTDTTSAATHPSSAGASPGGLGLASDRAVGVSTVRHEGLGLPLERHAAAPHPLPEPPWRRFGGALCEPPPCGAESCIS